MRDFELLLFWGKESFYYLESLLKVYKAIFSPCTFDSYPMTETEYIIPYVS